MRQPPPPAAPRGQAPRGLIIRYAINVSKNAGPPLVVAHCGGNSAGHLERAIAGGTDWLEVDVWASGRRVVCRHDPRLGPLPLTYSRKRLHWLPHEFELADVVETSADHVLLLDLKGPARRLPRTLARRIRELGIAERSLVCGQEWDLVDAVHEQVPGVRMFHSLGRPEHVTTFFERLRAGIAGHGVSAWHRLLTTELVDRLHDAGLPVVAWTLNGRANAERARDLGVDAMTGDDVSLLRSVALGLPEPALPG